MTPGSNPNRKRIEKGMERADAITKVAKSSNLAAAEVLQ
jgi:hypothetical protein